MASVASNLEGGRHRYLELTTTAEYYLEHMSYAFEPPHNPSYYPPSMGTAQEKALRTKRFQQNQALFQLCTAVDRSIKKQTATAVQPIFLYLLVDQLMRFEKVTALHMLQHLFTSYREMGEIDL